MGELISLQDRRAQRPAPAGAPRARGVRATFTFDLALPQTYLAAERVDRELVGVRWQPAYAAAVGVDVDRLRAAAEDRAAALGVPLIWPEEQRADVRPAMRAAALACESGRGAAFVLAASRLAFCGGFDLGDPEVLAEAAAAANLPLEGCLAAARDAGRDTAIEQVGARLRAVGVTTLPVARIGRIAFGGEERLSEAIAAFAAAEPPARRPAFG